MTKKGYKQTPGHIQRVKKARKKVKVDYGFTQKPEYREKMRNALSRSKNPRFGVHLSAETKAKISESERGKKVVVTEQHRQKISETLKGKFTGEKSWNWKGGHRNQRLYNPLLYAIRNSPKYKIWKKEILAELFPNGKPDDLQVHVHHIVKLSLLLKRNNITTLEQALVCEPLWDKKNAVVITKSEHFIVSALERRLKPSANLIYQLKKWLSEGNYKVFPIGEMNGCPYEDKVSYKKLV